MPNRFGDEPEAATTGAVNRFGDVLADAPKTADKSNAPEMGFGRRMLETGIGMAKGLGHTALGFSDLGRTLSGGGLVDRFRPERAKNEEAQSRAKVEEFLKPTNPSQEAGRGAEQLLEYVAPIGEEKLIAGVPKGLQTIARIAADTFRTGATAQAQTGDPKQALEAAATAGATSGLFSVLNKPIAALGRKIQASTIRPRLTDIRDGFKWSTLDKFKLKGNLEQSLEQVDTQLGKLRNQRNSLIAPGSARVDIGKAFDDALAEVKQQANSLGYGHLGATAQQQLVNMRKDIGDLVNGPQGLGKPIQNAIIADVSKAENLKEFLGTLGSWSYGHGDPDAKVSELVANTLYSKMRAGIEQSLGGQGQTVKALNKQMQELIPVKNAMLARLPVETRNQLFSLTDIAAMLPAVVTGDIRMLGLEGLTRAQKSLRFGNFLNRAQAVPRLGSKLGQAAGATVAEQ